MRAPVFQWIPLVVICLAGCGRETARPAAAPNAPAPTLAEAAVLLGHKDAVNALAFTPDGRYLISAGYGDMSVRSWDIQGRKAVHAAATEHRVRSLAISRSGGAVITGDVYGYVGFWNLRQGRLSLGQSIRNGDGPIQSLALSRDGRKLAVGSFDRAVTIWTSLSGPALRFETEEGGSAVVAFAPSGDRIVTAGNGPIFAVRDLTGKVERALVVSKVNANSAITAVIFSLDGTRFATAHNESTHSLWDPKGWRETHNSYVTDAATMAAAFSPDGSILATAQHGSGVHLWNAASGKEVAVVKGHAEPVESVAFSPDGKLLATGSRDKTIRLWKLGSPVMTASGR